MNPKGWITLQQAGKLTEIEARVVAIQKRLDGRSTVRLRQVERALRD